MSEENVETLRAMMAALDRRDFEDGVRYVDPDIELHPGMTELDVKSRYRGRDEFRRFAETITDAWETYVVEPEEIIEVPDGRVLAVERWRARGRQGIKFDFLLVDVYTFRDGLIVRIDGFRDRAAALEAVGLRESAMSQENVAVVRQQFEATNRREFARPMADWADDIEVVETREGDIRSGTYAGREAVGEFFGACFRAFRAVHFELLEIRDGEDSVAVAARHRAQGKYSGIDATEDFFYEYRLRGGKIVRIRIHQSWSEALEAAGLRE